MRALYPKPYACQSPDSPVAAQSRRLMAPYLPRDGASASPFSEGGALYALGLIHANHGQDIRCDTARADHPAGQNHGLVSRSSVLQS